MKVLKIIFKALKIIFAVLAAIIVLGGLVEIPFELLKDHSSVSAAYMAGWWIGKFTAMFLLSLLSFGLFRNALGK